MFNNKVTKWLVASFFAMSHLCFAQAITVSHPLGETQLKATPKRVVVLGMDSLDSLDALGIEPIGVVKSPAPTYLKKYQSEKYKSVGTLFEPDFEAIYTLKPDLIIVSNRSSLSFDALSKIAPTVSYMADPADFWKTTTASWRMLATIFAKQAQVEALIAQQKSAIDAIKQRNQADDAKALVVMRNGTNLTTFGAMSRYGVIFDLFGFKEALSNDTRYQHGDLISFEYITQVDPQYMLVLDRDTAIGHANKSAKESFNNPLINKLSVYKDDHIHYLNSHAWYISASGIQATQLMIDDMNAINGNGEK
ncbi:siderophore ABC transporter substrate-binding protein [Psychromonas sp. psych-6C06]|uniref:siderophore ABC transporter substrate-binding protein n=1 Tax=Psychromonas sp. psych-6C06 TaxID=2058089 RepID=UPI000C335FAC|nr:siderophore ABC transporter substrate-binding protein [Psychromonas sp. psych-6C06]PKF61565.1 siderophore ABC transporter substrate-binding protein [Psychromonas sp. psych-6C06]